MSCLIIFLTNTLLLAVAGLPVIVKLVIYASSLKFSSIKLKLNMKQQIK